jgi:hypothetical protein
MKNYTTIFFSLFCLFFAIIVIFNYINFFFHLFIFISSTYVLPFFFTLIFFLSNLYIIFYSIDYFYFIKFTLNSGNNYEFFFVETQIFQYISHLIFQSIEFFCIVFLYVLKLVSFIFIYVKDG